MNDVFFSPGDDCANAIMRLIRNAKSTIEICVFTISDNYISDALLSAHKNGIAIRIITDNEKQLDHGSDIARLRDSGISVRTDFSHAHMHHKFAIFDNKIVLSGSYNWTTSAKEENFENIVVSDNSKLVSAFHQEFQRLWSKFSPDSSNQSVIK